MNLNKIQVTETFKSPILCPSIAFIRREFLCPIIEGITIGRIKETQVRKITNEWQR